jgi:dienelactone hydrolase
MRRERFVPAGRSDVGMRPTNDSGHRAHSLRRLVRLFTGIRRRLRADIGVRKGASAGLVLLVCLLAGVDGIGTGPGLPGVLDELPGVVWHIGQAALYGLVLGLALMLILILRRYLNWAGIVALIVFVVFARGFKFPLAAAVVTVVLVPLAQAALGGSIAFLFSRRRRSASTAKKTIAIVVMLCALGFDFYLISWLADRGDASHIITHTDVPSQAKVLDLQDPSDPGRYRVLKLTYGSGKDKRRPEFGENADLTTSPVDATPFLDGQYGWKSKIRRWYWGLDATELPTNGSVWYPEGAGPYPLVLMTHGDHRMEEPSDPGYAYLGELLASRGFIFVSVDLNYLNGSFFSGGFGGENDCRAYMMLQHLIVWRQWNATEKNPFYRKVDMSNIGLIGHSRGGEAVAVAGAFNRLRHYPDDAMVRFDFDFDIKAIVSIAPCDGQYRPAGHPVRLENVNYLLIQGAHDADAYVFLGSRQYQRVAFTDGGYWFKALVYSYRSNHGQFNTVWGEYDANWPMRLILNRAAYLEGEEQRDICKTYISAFLESTLHNKKEYIPMFRDHRAASDWLPEDVFISQFEDASFSVVADYEEDIDLTTGSAEGSRIQASGLEVWKEQEIRFRDGGGRSNHVVYLGWCGPGPGAPDTQTPTYRIELDRRLRDHVKTLKDPLLVFSLAKSDEEPPSGREDEGTGPGDQPEEGVEQTGGRSESGLIDISVGIISETGVSVSRPLSDSRAVPPALRTRYTKLSRDTQYFGSSYEPVLQTFEVRLASLVGPSGPEVKQIKMVSFIFDQSREGSIILDNVGFAESGDALGEIQD